MHYPHAPGPYPFTALAPYPHVQHQHYLHPRPPKNDTHDKDRIAELENRIADLERQRTELEELTVGYMTQKEDWKEKCLSLHKKYKLKKQKLEGTTKRLHQFQCVLSRGANYVMCVLNSRHLPNYRQWYANHRLIEGATGRNALRTRTGARANSDVSRLVLHRE